MANPVTISMPRIKHAPIMVPANALQGGGPLNGDEIFVTTGLSAQQASQQWKFEAVDGLPGVYTIANAQPDNHGETVYVSANVPAKGSKLILYYRKISPGGVIDSTQLWRIIPRTGGSANSQIQNFYSDPNDPGTAYVIDLPNGDTSKPLQLYNLKSSDTNNQQFFYARI